MQNGREKAGERIRGKKRRARRGMEFACEKLRLLADEFESVSSTASSSSSSSCSSPSMIKLCRICHEEEDENSSSMEAPCSCSGTLKFAHRSCIQRWCYERGSDVCEICLQKFEPEYPVTLPFPVKPSSSDAVITIRGNLSKHINGCSETSSFIAASEPERNNAQPSITSSHIPSYCRLLILMITVILLVKNLIVVLSGTAEDYAFSLATVFMLRALGILLPFYLIMSLINTIQKSQKQHLFESQFTRMEHDVEQQ